MTLTPRGKNVVATLVLTASAVWFLATLVLGQYLWHQRMTDDTGLIPPLEITCQEDMACWDCTTMGNKRCGP